MSIRGGDEPGSGYYNYFSGVQNSSRIIGGSKKRATGSATRRSRVKRATAARRSKVRLSKVNKIIAKARKLEREGKLKQRSKMLEREFIKALGR